MSILLTWRAWIAAKQAKQEKQGEGMMETSAPNTPEISAPPRRRVLPASRQSTNSAAFTMRPSFGSTPENLGEAFADHTDHAPASRGQSPYVSSLAKSPYRSPHKSTFKSPHKSPHKSPSSKIAWNSSADATHWREPGTPERANLQAGQASVQDCAGLCWNLADCDGLCWTVLDCNGLRGSAVDCAGLC